MSIVCQQTILVKYHALFVIFEKSSKIFNYCLLQIIGGSLRVNISSALDKLLGQLGTYATWLSSIAYLQKQLRIFIFFYATFFSSVITRFLIA